MQFLRFQRTNLCHLVQPRERGSTIAVFDFSECERAVCQHVGRILRNQLLRNFLCLVAAVCDKIRNGKLLTNLQRLRRLAQAMLQLLHGVGRFPAGEQRARKVVYRVVLVVVVSA